MSSRRNFFIRALSALAVDITVGIALASACTWIIEPAALGMFLSFMLWMLSILMSLALSQYVVHPVVKTLLSDRKLDDGIAAVSSGVQQLARFAEGFGSPPWEFLLSRFGAYARHAHRR